MIVQINILPGGVDFADCSILAANFSGTITAPAAASDARDAIFAFTRSGETVSMPWVAYYIPEPAGSALIGATLPLTLSRKQSTNPMH